MKMLLMAFFMLVLLSCSKNNQPAQNTPSIQLFPHEIGNQWVYSYDDGLHSSGLLIYVDIVGRGTLTDGQQATIWTATLQDGSFNRLVIDSSFVVADDLKAVFYFPPCLSCQPPEEDEKRRYIFPLQTGNRLFTDKPFGDTTWVLSEGSLAVPAGTFNNSFKLSRTVGYVTNSNTRDTIWLTPNVGMTKYHQSEYNLGPVPGNGVWELVRYKVR